MPNWNEHYGAAGSNAGLEHQLNASSLRIDASAIGDTSAVGEIVRLSELIRERSISWANQARALKFEMEFQAVEQERKRIAKELHDEALPLLARLQRTISQSSEKTAEQGYLPDSLSFELHKVTQSLRDLLGELHPVDLQELGLVAALDGLCQRYSRSGCSQLAFRSRLDDCPLSELQQLSIYRAIQLVLKAVSKVNDGRLQVFYEQNHGKIYLSISSQTESLSIARFFLHDLEEPAIDSFFAWCSIAGAQVELSPAGIVVESEAKVVFPARPLTDSEARAYLKFPCALNLSIELPKETVEKHAQASFEATSCSVGELEQERIEELSAIVSHAQEEWARLASKDLSVITTVAVAMERQRLLGEIEELVRPALRRTRELLSTSPTDPLELRQRLFEVERAVGNSIARVYPPELENMSILALIRLLVARFERATLIATKLIASDSDAGTLVTNAKLSAYRIVQELLHNIEKHAAASNTLVIVEHSQERLLVCIEDDGIGCSGESQMHSLGIRTIQERAREIGARVCWQKSISYANGTLVTITIPACSIRQSPKS